METGSPAADDTRVGVPGDAVDYLRDLESRLRYWYSAAETKAQIVLTLNGVFLAFLTGSSLANRGEAAQTTAAFGPETWVFLAGMGAGLAGAVACAVLCLLARGVWPGQAREALALHGVDPSRAETYSPEVTAFFAYLAELRPECFAERLRTADPGFLVQALATHHVEWSQAIRRKHQWVNAAFVLTGVTLGCFLCAAVSYLARVGAAA